jgi:3-methyladenine DNA glycosylase AlkC
MGKAHDAKGGNVGKLMSDAIAPDGQGVNRAAPLSTGFGLRRPPCPSLLTDRVSTHAIGRNRSQHPESDMSEQAEGQYALKDIFDEARFRHMAGETLAVWPAIRRGALPALALDGLDELGIMERVRRTAECYRATLPEDFEKATGILCLLGPRVNHAFAAIALAEYVALYGRDRISTARWRCCATSPASARPNSPSAPSCATSPSARSVLRDFAEDENEHVRRLASEGSRPRLPWSFRLSAFAADPSLAFPILDRLKADPSLYVRKSVANHLNDISKDHPTGCWTGWRPGRRTIPTRPGSSSTRCAR